MKISRLLCFLTVLLSSLAVPSAVQAQNAVVQTVLHTFGRSDGSDPEAPLVQDADGNFYGTTFSGGANGYGTIFKLTPAGAYTVLHDFNGGDGSNPAAPLVLGSDGSLYGTTLYSVSSDPAAGTFFKVTPTGEFTVLHSFDDATGGGSGEGLVLGSDGSFYGTTQGGGAYDDGTVFRITPQGAYSIVYSFSGGDGRFASGPLTLGSDGNFYGVTSSGGANQLGTVFKLTPAGELTTLHSFEGSDGNSPISGLVEGDDGNFYGTTYGGGAYDINNGNGGAGTVFRITPAGAFAVLHDFNGTDGVSPYYGLTRGQDGNFYGTTYHTAFQIDPFGDFTLLYDSETGGGGMLNGIVQGADGSLYGTAQASDSVADGNFYKLTVAPVPSSFFAGQVMFPNGYYYLNYDTTDEVGHDFGYYTYLEDRRYIYNTVLGYEYVFDAADGQNGVYFYDFKSQNFFYTSPSFPYPYLYDFGLQSVVFFFVGPELPSPLYDPVDNRYFYVFSTGQIIQK